MSYRSVSIYYNCAAQGRENFTEIEVNDADIRLINTTIGQILLKCGFKKDYIDESVRIFMQDISTGLVTLGMMWPDKPAYKQHLHGFLDQIAMDRDFTNGFSERWVKNRQLLELDEALADDEAEEIEPNDLTITYRSEGCMITAELVHILETFENYLGEDFVDPYDADDLFKGMVEKCYNLGFGNTCS